MNCIKGGFSGILVRYLTSAQGSIRVNPHEQWCHNRTCRAYGRKGEGHIVIHSQKERRYRCKRCSRTFSATKGTVLYRMHKPTELVLTVVTLLAHGCPVQAIVAAFGLDERTVARWQIKAGSQCKRVHEHLIEAGRVELSQVQADEIRVKALGGVWWLAQAIEVKSRLWLGGVVSHSRDRELIRSVDPLALLTRVRACGPVRTRSCSAPTGSQATLGRPWAFSGSRCGPEAPDARGWYCPRE